MVFLRKVFYKGGEVKIEYDIANITTFSVNRTGGHITGNNILNQMLNTSGDGSRAGFAIIYDSPNTLKINFNSNGLNPKFHPTGTPISIAKILPENLQNQVLASVQNNFPNFQITIQ